MSTPYGTYPSNNYPQGGVGGNPPPYAPTNPYYPQNNPDYDPNVDTNPTNPKRDNQGGYDNAAGPAAPSAPPAYPPAYPPPAAIGGMRAYTPQGLMDDDDNMDSFSDKAIRRAFIRKVYLIVTSQLLFTLVFVILFSTLDPIKKFLRQYSWVYYIAYGIFFVTYIVLICVKSVRRKVPWNFICLFIFTAAFTYMTATISGFYETYIVVIALAITVAVCVGITIFAIQTKIDFTLCSGLLFVCSLVVLLFGIAVALTYAFASIDQFTARVLQCVYGAVCALLFSMYLVFDTQMLMGDKKNKISAEEYIYGALQLYMDMIQIFLAILQIAGAIKN